MPDRRTVLASVIEFFGGDVTEDNIVAFENFLSNNNIVVTGDVEGDVSGDVET